MDPVSVVTGALLAGVGARATDVTSQAIKDAVRQAQGLDRPQVRRHGRRRQCSRPTGGQAGLQGQARDGAGGDSGQRRGRR